jgi:hypothetical protein
MLKNMTKITKCRSRCITMDTRELLHQVQKPTHVVVMCVRDDNRVKAVDVREPGARAGIQKNFTPIHFQKPGITRLISSPGGKGT